ncbi:MAG: prepilin-type N-terminal cleavage/methylation domain-containing protein [Acidithiobacillus sp.]|nr:prepilin-type N-terminal cleavage/methylation domain-containing protein [Acidithiobacillus sp.]
MKMLSARTLRPRETGFTLVEIMVVITIMAIILGIAAPYWSLWLVRAKIQSSADGFQQSLTWAEGYAIRSGLMVAVTVSGPNANGACAWTITPTTTSTLQSVPSLNYAQFSNRYHGITCSINGPATLDIYPSGMVEDPTTSTLSSIAVTFSSTSANNAANYGYWQILLSGGGGIRNCAANSVNGSYQCAMQ